MPQDDNQMAASAQMPTEGNDDQMQLVGLRFTPAPDFVPAKGSLLQDTKMSREIIDAACNLASSHDFELEKQHMP